MNPWEDPRTPWKNKSQFMTYIRGCLRKAWNTHPVKLSVIKNSRKQIPNPNPRGNRTTVWGFECELCGIVDVIKNAQVDHIHPCGKLQEVSDIQGFAERLLVVTEEDLRLICKPCNSALAYADKHGVSFEEALIEKQVIAFGKLSVKEQQETLRGHGFSEDEISNARKRKDCYRKYLKRG